MIQNFKIDQAATFEGVRLWSCEPKIAFGDQYRQEMTKDGTPKWEAQLVATFRRFGRPENEIIKVGVAAGQNPGESISLGTPVTLVDFEIGVMEKKDKEGNVTGASVWYRCAELRPTAATPNGQRGRQVAAEAS
jgi:hypothetical protein